MLGISNALRQRLGKDPEPHLHPDADLLTAYAEHSLSPAEQADMVRHLAACFYCREVVALSQPEMQVQPELASLPTRSGLWLPWVPMLRWAALAATVVVGATLVIEKPWKPSNRATGARNEVAVGDAKQASGTPPAANATPAASERFAEPASTIPSVAQPMVSPSPVQTALAKDARSAKDGRADSMLDRTANYSHSFALADETRSGLQSNNAGGIGRGTFNINGIAAGDMAAKSMMGAGAPPPPVKAADADLVSAPTPKPAGEGPSETGFVVRSIPITTEGIAKSSFAVAFDNEKTDKADKKETAGFRASTDNLGTIRLFRVPSKVLSASKDKLASALSNRSSSGMALMERAQAAPPAEGLHWSISPDGKLIKSADLAMWHEAYPQKDNLLFKVVVAEGHDVWAGGNHMTLIHSWNGGVDWKKLKLGDAATGDITDIQIGSGDVQIKTSNNQTFVSQDGGVTWVPLKAQPK